MIRILLVTLMLGLSTHNSNRPERRDIRVTQIGTRTENKKVTPLYAINVGDVEKAAAATVDCETLLKNCIGANIFSRAHDRWNDDSWNKDMYRRPATREDWLDFAEFPDRWTSSSVVSDKALPWPVNKIPPAHLEKIDYVVEFHQNNSVEIVFLAGNTELEIEKVVSALEVRSRPSQANAMAGQLTVTPGTKKPR